VAVAVVVVVVVVVVGGSGSGSGSGNCDRNGKTNDNIITALLTKNRLRLSGIHTLAYFSEAKIRKKFYTIDSIGVFTKNLLQS
jgi:hypothetical protein